MRRRLRSSLTDANVMSTIAVFGVLAGGGAWAASKIGTDEIEKGAVTAKKLHRNSVTGKKVQDDKLTGNDIDESTLSAPINVNHAAEADHAKSADNATLADNATNLDGQPASDYRLHCPGDLARAGDLCFEFGLRDATYTGALKACARAQLRLPNAGELALVFDHLGAEQPEQWVAAGHFQDELDPDVWATNLRQNSSRDLLLSRAPADFAQRFFRCVTSATN